MPRNIYDDDHQALRASAREFIDRVMRPRAEEMIELKSIPRDIWKEAGKQGFFGFDIPEAYGGAGVDDYRFNAVVAEEWARFNMATSSCFGIHADVCPPYIVDLGTEEQKQRWLPGIASGDLIIGIGMTEPSGGSDLAALKTTAVRDGEDWLINGSKTFITNGYQADLIIVAARTEAMITDPVYEGKSMQGLIDLVRKGFFPAGTRVLYAHLGGAPALNGYSYTYRNG